MTQIESLFFDAASLKELFPPSSSLWSLSRFPLRRIDNEERRGTCLVANGWWMALGKDIAFTWWTSREDDWGWRARPLAVQCNRNNIYNNLSTAFIRNARILVGFSRSLTGSANDKPATRVSWTWKWALKGMTSPERFFCICNLLCSLFVFSSISMNLLDVLQKNEECTQQLCAPLHTCSSWSPVDHN